MELVYFDSSVFLAIFAGEPTQTDIKLLIRELRADSVRICTSILTIQEVSVLSFRAGTPVADNHSKVDRMARIHGITCDIALTAAKFEAHIGQGMQGKSEEERRASKRRRKVDCFHIATAVHLGCRCLYTLDEEMLTSRSVLSISMEFSRPAPRRGVLFPEESLRLN